MTDSHAASDVRAATRVAIAAPHAQAVEAARRIAEAGGNAVDAAVAAAITLTVVYPHQCSIGGDLFALVRTPDGRIVSVNASGAYGSGARADAAAVLLTGPESVSVPGAVSGWASLLEIAGSLPLRDIVAPAIEAASAGITIGARLASAISEIASEGIADAGLRTLLTGADGKPLGEGDLLVQPAVAEVLDALGRDGLGSFYDGPTASRVIEAFDRLGVPVTAADLSRHAAQLESPLTATLDGCRVSTSPPNSQGYLLPRTLLIRAELERRGIEPAPRVLAEIFWHADERRDVELADPAFMTVSPESVLTPEQVSREADVIQRRLDGAERSAASAASRRPTGDTVAVTAVSDDGIAVSLIQSLFHSFGSGVRDESTGIVFHNRGAFFSPDPSSPNAIAPGKRPSHTLMPVIVEYPDGRLSAHGTMGGKAQPQIHTQLLHHSLAGLDPQAVVTRPRFVVGGLEAGSSRDFILAEPGVPTADRRSLESTGMEVATGAEQDENVGHAMIASLGSDGTLSAGSDPRSDGGQLVAWRL